MKKIINFIRSYIRQWKDYFLKRKIDRINHQLHAGLLEKMRGRVALKKEIVGYITTEYKVHPGSKFIPSSLRRRIVDDIYQKFRPRMDQYGVTINYNLQFAK